MTIRSALVASLALGALAIGAPARAQEELPAEPRTLPQGRPPLVGKGIYLVRDFRNPTLAAALSMVVPGGGQIYNDDIAKFLGAAAGLAGSGALLYYTQDPLIRIVAGSGLGLTWLWSVSDAYLAAALYNHQLEELAY